jgi:diguanylate cyclase (GGDEF)-like protein
MPQQIRKFLDRTFHLDEVIVLLTRNPSNSEPEKEQHLIVAASKETTVQAGQTIRLGTGQMGCAAHARHALGQTALEALLHEFSPGEVDTLFPFRASLSAPMSIGNRVLGVVAMSKPRWGSVYAKSALDLVGQISAVSLSNAIALSKIRSESEIDPLTRIYHKGALSKWLAQEVAKADSEDTDLSVFLMDIDHFKNYNDLNGHLAGDELLKQLTELVLDETRAQSIFGRFGGEEFLLILPGRSSEIATYVAEEIRQRIEGHLFPYGREQPLGKLTISGGIASKGHLVRSSRDLLTAADAALYRAKQSGRNRVLVSQSSFAPPKSE